VIIIIIIITLIIIIIIVIIIIIIIIEGKDFNTFTGHEQDRILHIPKHTCSTQISHWGNRSSQSAEATFFLTLVGVQNGKSKTLRDPCLKVRDRIIKVLNFETVQRAASPRFRESCLECRDFETGLIFSEMHHFLMDHSIPLLVLALNVPQGWRGPCSLPLVPWCQSFSSLVPCLALKRKMCPIFFFDS